MPPASPAAPGATAAAAHRATVTTGKQPLPADAALPAPAAPAPAWPGLEMPPADAPYAAAALRGQQADAALATALPAAKSEASAAQERVRAAALAWERERSVADALTRRVAEVEHYFRVSSGPQPVVPFTEHGASSSHQAPPSGSRPRLDPTDPMVVQLHLQAASVQNIKALVSVLLDPTSSSYGR